MVSTGGGLRDLGLIGNGVLVWDDDVLGTYLSLGSSGLGGEFGVGSGSFGRGQVGVLVSKAISLPLSVSVLSAAAVLFLLAALWGTLERDGGDASDEGSNSEFHFS